MPVTAEVRLLSLDPSKRADTDPDYETAVRFVRVAADGLGLSVPASYCGADLAKALQRGDLRLQLRLAGPGYTGIVLERR